MKTNRKHMSHLAPLFQPALAMLLLVLLMGQSEALAAPGDIVTIAGGGAGDGSPALSVPLTPETITYDASGNLYIADCNGNRVRKVDTSGTITTVAGIGGSGFSGDGGPAVEAALSCPSGVAVDSSGNIFISDQSNNRIRKVDVSGVITTLAGTGSAGFSGDGGPAGSAAINRPYGIAVDASGSVFFADYLNHRIRKINSSGTISTAAGSGSSGFYGDGGSAANASLNYPIDVSIDGFGNLYIADTNNYRIRKVNTFGTISTFAGNGTSNYAGDNGYATSASLRMPFGVHADPSGNVYIADYNDNRVRMVNASGIISTVAGTGVAGFSGDGAAATAANLYHPGSVAHDASGNLVISDRYNCRVRRVASGVILTIAGSGSTGFFGEGVAATSAMLSKPLGLSMGPSGSIYVVDYNNNRVRKIDTNGVIGTVAGTGENGFYGDGGPATLARLYTPQGVAADAAGNVFISDVNNVRIRRVDASGVIATVAGTGNYGYQGDNGPATSAWFKTPYNVAADQAGNFFIADFDGHRIRKVDPSGIVTTIAGSGTAGFSGDGGPASAATINSPRGIAVDAAGNIFFSDKGNQRIRKIDGNGVITTLAGSGTAGFSGDGGDALAAMIQNPDGIAVDAAGNVFFADATNQRVRRVDGSGIITTVAGNGTKGFAGDNGPATAASLNFPSGVFIDAVGNIFLTDSGNNRVRRVNSALGTSGNLIINSGAPSTNDVQVTLTLTCTSQSGTCTDMQLSNNGVWSPAEPFAASKAWTLSSGDGEKTVFAKFKDDQGNWSAIQSGSIVLDTTPPAITITSPQGLTNSSVPLLSFTLSDGTATVKVDGAVVGTVSGGHLDALAEGVHTVRVEAVDALGNAGFAEKVFTVDTVAPAVAISSPASGVSYTTDPTLAYTASDGTVTVKLDGVVVSKPSGSTLGSLSEGNHTVRVESKDAAGNVGYSEVTFARDLPPTVSITSPTSAYLTTNTPVLGYAVSNGTVVVKVDGAVVGNVSGDNLGPLPEGPHTLRVEATDAAGTSFAERTFTVDTTPPVVTITSPPNGTTSDSQPLLNFSISSSDGYSGYSVKVDGVQVVKGNGSRLSNLPVGTHTVRVQTADSNGNIGFAENTFTVTQSIPGDDFESGTLTKIPWVLSGNALWGADTATRHAGSFSAAAPVALTDSQSASMDVSKVCAAGNLTFWYSVSSEANYDYLILYIDGVQKGKWSGAVAWTQASFAVPAGNHNFKWVYAKDGATSAGSDTAWIDDVVFPAAMAAPTITISSPTGITNNTTPLLTYSVSDGAVVVKVDGVAVSKVSGNALDALAAGNHRVRVESTNASGTSYAEKTFTVDTTGPILAINPVLTPSRNNSQVISGTRDTNATIALSADTAATFDSVSYPTTTTWSSTVRGLVEGANTVTVRGTDVAGNSASTATTITLDTVAPVVTLSAPVSGTTVNNRTPVLTYSLSEGAALVTVDGVAVAKASGDTLGPLADGPHTVLVTATDAAGNSSSAEASFSVDATAPTVTITSPTAGFTNNRSPLFAFTVSDGTAVVTVDGVVLPLLSGDSLGALADGTHVVHVEASDAAGNSAFAEVSFTVDTAAPSVTISSPAAGISNNRTPLLTYTLSEGTAVVKVDGVVVNKALGDALDPLVDGLHVVRVEAVDGAGNSGFAETSFTIDATAPVVSITSPVAGPGGSTTPLAFTVTDGTVLVKLDGVAVSKASGDLLGPLAPGAHTVRVEATDAAGNLGFSEVSFSVETYTVTLNAGPNGSIEGPAVVNYGDLPSYTIVPNTGYHVTDVTVNGSSVGAVTSYAFTSGITTNTIIAAGFAADTFAVTMAAEANGTIAGPAEVPYGGSANYAITPAVGYHVTDVAVDGVSVGAVTSYTITNVTTTHAISASFAINSYTISASAGANGAIAGPASVTYGGSANYAITPAAGYHVADVLVDGVSVGAVTSYSLLDVTASHAISASFSINSYAIIASSGANGSITGPASVTYGGSASYTITPAVGYHVADVLVDDVSVGAVTSYSLLDVTASHAISASFSINSYAITSSSGASGSIAGPASVTYGGSASYTITPAVGYHVADVLVDGVSVGAVMSYSFTNVTAPHAIGASFAINSYSITASAGANGSIAGAAAVDYGGTASYTITPAAGYGVANVLVDGGSVGAVTSYSFTNVTASHTISATFAALADLVVNSVSGPANATRGNSISVSSSISNQGGNAGSFTVAFYLSKDNVVTDADLLLGTKTVTSLNSGSTVTVSGSFTVPAAMTAGKYYVGVVADSNSVVQETNENNNSKTAGGMVNIK